MGRVQRVDGRAPGDSEGRARGPAVHQPRSMSETVAAADPRPAWPWTGALDDALAHRREELFDLTARLVAFVTPCPPGRNTAPIQEFLAGRLRALGAAVETLPLYPGDPQLVAHLRGRGGGRSLVLNGHVDVASIAPGEPWT